MFRRDYLCIRWSRCELLEMEQDYRKEWRGSYLFRAIHDKRRYGAPRWPLFCTKCSVQRFPAANERQLKMVTFSKWHHLPENTELLWWLLLKRPPHTVISCLFFFFFYCCRQIQRLRNLKGAKCEEHHHQRPWGPAMLGARLHVVSLIAPVSECVCLWLVSHQLWLYTVLCLC